MSSEALLRLDKFTKLFPAHLSGAPSNYPYDYLDHCHEVLRNMGIVETNRVDFSMFQIMGSVNRWWRDYILTRPAGLPALTWDQFSELFLEKFIPVTQREEYRRQFEYLWQGSMTVTLYETRFGDLAHHTIILLPIKRERVRRFIDGPIYTTRLQMAKEIRSDISFQSAANITRKIEMVHAQERGQVLDKRPRHSGGFSGASSGGRGSNGPYVPYPGQPAYSAPSAPISALPI
ncbi:uncharacterized protein [Nicotiana tomentosiformis]|uniref:uncharacterized protein n=1 Tax=Nicotiana tomentosiformis TaxID=4098 RepID=UPI00388CA31E